VPQVNAANGVDADPWVVMDAPSIPDTSIGGTSAVTGSINTNSDGDPVTVPAGAPSAFVSSNTFAATVAPATSSVDANGDTDAVATGQDTGVTNIDVTIDHQTITRQLTVTGAAATRYVATDGDDDGGSNNCKDSGNPCLTVGHAIARAASGDTVSIENGDYPEAGLTVNKQIHFVGESEAGVVVGPTVNTNQNTFSLGNASDGTSFSSLTVLGRTGGQFGAIASSASGADDITITGVTIKGPGASGFGVSFGGDADGWTLDDVAISGFLSGIDNRSGKVTDTAIDNSDISGNDDGIFNLRNTVANETVFDGLTVTDTVFNGNRERGLYFEGLSNATFTRISVDNTSNPNVDYTSRAFHLNLKRGDYENIALVNSKFTDSLYEGIVIQARNDGGYASEPATLANFSANGLTVSGNGGPGFSIENRNSIITPIEIHGSRIVGNGFTNGTGTPGGRDSNAPANGIYSYFTDAAVDAQNNWFGCNAGPVTGGPA
jgi:hypothetical protein